MTDKRYAIIDIETTGGRAARDKITEIAIVLHDGRQILDTFETLLNPETPIPYHITELTGISNEMVADAPKFYEVAKKIVEMTEGAIFVAHNVRFDYTFIREEFARLGYTYTRKQLCTVRLARKVFPGLPSYSLGNLIRHFDIKVKDRHRAMADTLATVQLFEKIMAAENGEERTTDLINLGIREALLPPNITLETLHALPEACGVYYFHDMFGDVVYVGKSINIKKRVAQHFSKKTEKGGRMQKYVHEISWEITGSELVALLLESYEIKRLRPIINRAQRVQHFPYMVYQYKNEAGYLCFEVEKTTKKSRLEKDIVAEFPKIRSARGRLEMAKNTYQLCARFCGFEKGTGPCFDYHLKRCAGACVEAESPEIYNERARQAADWLSTVFEDSFILIDKGRTNSEKSVILVENGVYRGFGYVSAEFGQAGPDDLRNAVKTYPGNPETQRIIRKYMAEKKHLQIIPIEEGM
ncbi:MAG: DNA polymerase III subunit epsilon [Bacteroidetes bacterium]|nr:MAG: DNA polymerase III subunit epsilon [Bacteroidota bacterium]